MRFDDLMPKIPADMEPSIVTPHAHEDPERHPPLWLIWKRRHYNRSGLNDFPMLDSVCTTEASARYHIRAALEGAGDVYCERIPANHRFGSSLGDWQMQAHMALWKERLKRKDGD